MLLMLYQNFTEVGYVIKFGNSHEDVAVYGHFQDQNIMWPSEIGGGGFILLNNVTVSFI